MTAKKKAPKAYAPPELSPASEEDDSVYDSEDYYDEESSNEHAGSGEEESEDDDEDSEDEFEDQGSSDEDDDRLANQEHDDDSSVGSVEVLDDLDGFDATPRTWKTTTSAKRAVAGSSNITDKSEAPDADKAAFIHTDDLSSDDEDEDGAGNRIGRVPLHWYEEYDHIGYDAHGSKVVKSASLAEGDKLDQAIANSENKTKGKFVVHDALNDKDVELTERQLDLIRRVQAGAYAHPEFDGNAEYIDYYSGVDKEISGINSHANQPKARFQPSQWDKLQVERLLQKLENGSINMDYLTGKIRDMNDAKKKGEDPNQAFMLWAGDEEDELSMRKGPQHIAAPKAAPPGHAESYIPPDEYLPTKEDLKEWGELDVKDRPHGLLVPKKFPNLRSVGAYPHSVREAFERCLDLYLCPRVMKRRLNIDPESLVPHLPKPNDLRPFPTAQCIEYKTPYADGDEAPIIRAVSPSPDGQFLASGASDGFVRLWEVHTGRLLRSWNVSKVAMSAEGQDDDNIKPVVCVEWNPSNSHHCLVAAAGKCVAVISTGTGDEQSAILTQSLLLSASQCGNVTSAKASKAVQWKKPDVVGSEQPLSAYGIMSGFVSVLKTTSEVTSVRWHRKGDYFVTVSPKAGAAAVLIHQLSKGNSQQPFSKAKGEAQLACFHPNKPFLFVASQQHVRIYHLVKQTMVKRLVSGCRWISSLDVHPTGDHLLVGSLDRRMIWFDLDLSTTPYKTLKYHERALRSVGYHTRYPLMASASDDGVVHVFHSMVYSDLMRNPLVVPVKILKGHTIRNRLGVLSLSFHPTQPWLFSGGADGRILLYQDI